MMDFIEHTQNWIKGEIFEARWIILFALLTIVVAILFWKTGTTPNAKAMFFPLLAVGILFLVSGSTMLYTNPKRSVEYAETYKEDPANHIKAEKERVENFMTWYPQIRYVMTGIAALGILLFLVWAVPLGRAIGIALILTALATFVIDHFSEERANIYYEQIIFHLK
jgi:hypothetical protein